MTIDTSSKFGKRAANPNAAQTLEEAELALIVLLEGVNPVPMPATVKIIIEMNLRIPENRANTLKLFANTVHDRLAFAMNTMQDEQVKAEETVNAVDQAVAKRFNEGGGWKSDKAEGVYNFYHAMVDDSLAVIAKGYADLRDKMRKLEEICVILDIKLDRAVPVNPPRVVQIKALTAVN